MESFTELVAGVLEPPATDIADDLGPASHDAWTSIKHLQLIVALEDRYGVSFTRDEVREIRTVGGARQCVLAKGAQL